MEFRLSEYGFLRVATCSPMLKVANIEFNIEEIKKQIDIAYEKGSKLIVFPELSISGYTMGDLFFQNRLIEESYKGIEEIMEYTREMESIIAIGNPFVTGNQMFNCAFLLSKGEILGIVPKTHIPNYNAFYEKKMV